LALWALSAHAQVLAPLPKGAPGELTAPALKVHVIADEALGPDRLRSFARPNVSLWLRAGTNTLKDSTLEHLARFDEAWVALKPPLSDVDARQLMKAPKAGLWLEAGALEPRLLAKLPGARRLAVTLEGPLDEAVVERLTSARVSFLSWRPKAPIDVLSWGLFRALPGKKVLVAPPAQLLAVKCPARSAAEPSLELDVATLLAMSSDVFPCSAGTRVVVRADADAWLVQSLLVREPSVELVLDVRADGDAGQKAAKLLDALALPRR
jgi:hypothetical protein